MYPCVNFLDWFAKWYLFDFGLWIRERKELCYQVFLDIIDICVCAYTHLYQYIYYMYTKLTSICTTRSLIVLASLFSSIILSNPNALVEFLKERLRECVDDDEECVDPSRLGVGVLDLDDNVGVWVSLGRGASGAVSLWMGEGVDTKG